MLTQRQNFWLIIGPAVMMFAFALTSPIVQIYFIKLVDPQVLAIANMLGIGLAAAVNATVTKDKFLNWYRKHFFWIVTLDIFSYIIICYVPGIMDAKLNMVRSIRLISEGVRVRFLRRPPLWNHTYCYTKRRAEIVRLNQKIALSCLFYR